jgi:hypothetical protein
MDMEDLAIDPHNLDEDWLRQPILYARAAGAVEDNTRMRDSAKLDLENDTAEMVLRVGKKPGSYGLKDKPTVGDINATVTADENIQRAKRLLDTCSHQLLKAQNFLRAVDMRKKALEGMVQLFIAQYFSVPNEGKLIGEGKRMFAENLEKKATAKQRNLGKFSTPVTSPEERTGTDKEKFDKMSPELQESMMESTGKTKEQLTGERKPRKKLMRRKKA